MNFSFKSTTSVTTTVLLLWAVQASALTGKPPKRPKEPPKLRATVPRAQPQMEPVLVELYTSQGCSSCPPADKQLRRLLRDKSIRRFVVPLAFHVDYWNGLGWTDPYSNKAWSARQRAYAARYRHQQVATPSAVLDGHRQIPAARADLLRPALLRLIRTRHIGRIEIAVQDAQLAARVSINAYLRQDAPGRLVDVVVALYEDGLTTQVLRGENEGQDLRNDRVVRHLQVVDRISTLGGSICRKSVFVPLPANWKGRRFGVVAFLQARPSLRVLGTSKVHFGFAGDIPADVVATPAHKPKSILHQPL